jgi:hypothetical protein
MMISAFLVQPSDTSASGVSASPVLAFLVRKHHAAFPASSEPDSASARLLPRDPWLFANVVDLCHRWLCSTAGLGLPCAQSPVRCLY